MIIKVQKTLCSDENKCFKLKDMTYDLQFKDKMYALGVLHCIIWQQHPNGKIVPPEEPYKLIFTMMINQTRTKLLFKCNNDMKRLNALTIMAIQYELRKVNVLKNEYILIV